MSNTKRTNVRGYTRVLPKGCNSCLTSGIRCVIFFLNLMVRHEWGKGKIVIATIETFPEFSGFLVNSNPPSRKSWLEQQAMEHHINWEIYIPYLSECSYIEIEVHNGEIEMISFVVNLNKLSLSVNRYMYGTMYKASCACCIFYITFSEIYAQVKALVQRTLVFTWVFMQKKKSNTGSFFCI